MMDSDVITLYDLPGTTKFNAWSPNTWKIRFLLNFKKIPYKTSWVEYPDIKPSFQKIGIEHTRVLRRGPYYSVPAITDPTDSTGAPGDKPPVHIADSMKIAKYLEEKYPERPLFPKGMDGLQRLFVDDTLENFTVPMDMLIILGAYHQLNPASQPYFKETRETAFNTKIEDWCPEAARPEALEKTKILFNKLSNHFEATKGQEKDCIFVMEGQTVYADLALGAFLMWIKVCCPETAWPQVATWNEGRWDKLLTALLERYGEVL